MRILITGGGCREYIDSVRVVTNSSTGRTSAELADFFAEKGHEVTLITAESAIKAKHATVKVIVFGTGAELSHAIENELCAKPYNAVIHAAAVSDYVPAQIIIGGQTFKAGKEVSKLHSENDLTVVFKPAPKIADSLHEWAKKGGNPNAKIICFKLTNNADQNEKNRAVTKLFSHSNSDYIVANDLSEITKDLHPFKIIDSKGQIFASGQNNESMANALLSLLELESEK